MKGIKKTKSAWLIDVDEYTARDRYYTGTRAGVVIRTTEDPTHPHNDYFERVADLLIALDHDGQLPKTCTYYRRGYIVR